MPEYTTIQVTKAQVDELKRVPGNSHRESLSKLLQSYNSDSQNEDPGPVTLEPVERQRIAREVAEELRQ